MPAIHRSALLPIPAAAMFEVVADVPSYPDFLPWLAEAVVLDTSPEAVVAELALDARGMHQRFTTRNRMFPHERIELELVAGPFREFGGAWRFTRLGEDVGCKVELDLRFEFSGARALLSSAFSGVFVKAADHMVDAFCQRGLKLNA